MPKKKYNDKSPKFADWTTKKLKKEAKSYHYLINVVECYGHHDVISLSGIERELEQRGVIIYTELMFG